MKKLDPIDRLVMILGQIDKLDHDQLLQVLTYCEIKKICLEAEQNPEACLAKVVNQ